MNDKVFNRRGPSNRAAGPNSKKAFGRRLCERPRDRRCSRLDLGWFGSQFPALIVASATVADWFVVRLVAVVPVVPVVPVVVSKRHIPNSR